MDDVKILVVDDEQRMRKLVRDFLVRQDYVVLEAENGERAVDIFFSEKNISLIILDVMMPKMDGWEVCREIRQYSEVPIIMLTAKSGERDELQGFELGVDEAIALMESKNEPYKIELIKEHAEKGEPISFYEQGEFTELCSVK